MEALRKVFIMGEMLELGDRTERLHTDVGTSVVSSGIDILIGIGTMTQAALSGAQSSGLPQDATFFFADKAEAKRKLRKILRPDDLVLVKGSRMAGLEEICDFLRQVAVEGRT
jgi:UDP-N-acetylmuramoyl-tripeptide--D-alanyl-D-alanine ligase